jgi:2-methylcitrate dehydratase PrpD
MTITRELAAFLVRTRYEEIPSLAIDYAAMLISSTIASAAIGSKLESSRIVRNLVTQRGGVPESTVWFGGSLKLPVAAAARINALMSDAAASDDSDLRNSTHPGTTLAAASIAMAEHTGASGKEILTAIALGYEAAGRINTGLVPGLVYEKGFHGSVVTIFGGAVASALLLKLDEEKMTHALALAATSVGGLLVAAKTSAAREHHAGLAATLGVESAQLASMGYTAEEGVLEHPAGFFAAYGQDAHASGRVAETTRALGQEWQILRHMAIKLAPGGHPHHAFAEAAARASRLANVPASEIVAVVCSRPGMRSMAGPRHPVDLIGMAHSATYFAAAGAADREFTWAHASPEKIMDPQIRRLLDLVEVGEPPTEDAGRYTLGATVTIKTRDGRSFTSTVYAPRGSAVNGIEWPDVEGKFRALCPHAEISPARVDQCAQVLRGFRDVRHPRELVDLIC